MEPLRFNALVKAKKFTNGGDKEDIVLPKYAKTFSAVFAKSINTWHAHQRQLPGGYTLATRVDPRRLQRQWLAIWSGPG